MRLSRTYVFSDMNLILHPNYIAFFKFPFNHLTVSKG
jgi:hypothetical protein